MANNHFQNLIRCLELEGEEEAREVVQRVQQRSSSNAERSGNCLLGLVIRDETAGFGGRSVVTLGKRDEREELPWTRLNAGSPVVLSEISSAEGRWRGVVTERDRQTITVALAESPEPAGERPTFRLDLSADEIARQRQRSALLKAETAERGRLAVLKRRIMGLEPPAFRHEQEFTSLSNLDESQRAAIRFALSAEDIAIIHGPPGTGKTTTVVELIRQCIRRGERVLACAPSNLAVDNLLEKLIDANEKALRLGHPARVMPSLRDNTLDIQVESHPSLKLAREWTKEAFSLRRQAGKYVRTAPAAGARRDMRMEARKLLDDAREMEDGLVNHLLDSASVICCTLTGLNAELLRDREFDLVVIDEAGQTTEPACWIPLLRSKRLVLAGDHCQLPATVRSVEARKAGFHISLMERLITVFGDKASRRLTTQYRMHDQIMRFSSAEFYESSLVAAPAVCSHILADLPDVIANPLTQTAVRFIDTAGSECVEESEEDGVSLQNPGEADVAIQQVSDLIEAGVPADAIAVITPYSAQAHLIRDLLERAEVEVDTVDGFQGREKEAVVISMVRSNSRGEVGFLNDTRRMNVALTRPRRKLIVIGDSSTLANHDFYLRLLNYFEAEAAYGTVWD